MIQPTETQLGVLRVAVSAALFLAACVAFLLVRDGSLFASVLAIFVAGLLAIRLHRVASGELRNALGPVRRRIVVVVVGLGFVLLGAWFAFDRLDGFLVFGVALVYLGVGLGLQLARANPDLSPRLVRRWLLGPPIVVVLALLAVVAGFESAMLLVGLAVLAAPTGLSLLSELALRRLDGDGWQRSAVLAAAGAGLLGIGLLVVSQAGLAGTFLLALGGALVAVMLGITARSNIDVVFVVATAAIGWTLGHQSVPETRAITPPPDAEVFVALGDSFMSGEGAEAFFEGTNRPGESTCRRAPTAFAPTLALERRDDIPSRLHFLACSGAVADGIGRQLDDLPDDLALDRVEFVLLSVGGNDALFGTVGRGCLLPIDCTELEAAWTANLEGVGDRLVEVYREVRTALPGPPIYVVPYPIPITAEKGDCDHSLFSRREHRFLARFTQSLNATVATAAAEADADPTIGEVEVVDTMPGAFEAERLRLCDGRAGDVGVNFLAANSVLGSLEQSANPTNWVHNSLHPNARGHEAMRGAFVRWLDDGATTGAIAAAPALDVDADGPCAGERGDDLEGCSWDWIARELAAFLLWNAWTVLPALAGAWLLCLQTTRLWRAIFGTEGPATAA